MNDTEDGSYLWCSNCHKNGATFTVIGPKGQVYLCDECAAKELVNIIVGEADNAPNL